MSRRSPLKLSLGSLVLGSLGGIVSGLSTVRRPNTWTK
jgi:hypothetical protein